MSAPVRVLIVDDHPAVRAGVEGVLAAEPDLVPVASAATASAALACAREREPDVAVVDLHLGGEDGLTLTRRLRALPRPPRVLLFSAYADAPLAVAGVVAGAHGMLAKAVFGDELVDAVRAVARGFTVLPPLPPAVARELGAQLEPRDLPILGMLLHRVAPADIAGVLGIGPAALERRRSAMLGRLTRRVGRPAA